MAPNVPRSLHLRRVFQSTRFASHARLSDFQISIYYYLRRDITVSSADNREMEFTPVATNGADVDTIARQTRKKRRFPDISPRGEIRKYFVTRFDGHRSTETGEYAEKVDRERVGQIERGEMGKIIVVVRRFLPDGGVAPWEDRAFFVLE